jgi:hypothetical protein
MNALHLTATHSTPLVRFIHGNQLQIKGRSISEGCSGFYQPLIDWAYTVHVNSLTVSINLEYVNSTSLKKLLLILKILDVNAKIEQLFIHWHYEEGDEDSLEKGQVIESFLRKARFSFFRFSETS